jgi:hypothetical protein
MRWVLVVLLFAAACSKKADKPAPVDPDRPPPMSVEEQTRNTDACKAYAEQVCACATAHPDKTEVADMCKYDKGLQDAMALVMTTARNTETSPQDALLAQTKARKIAVQCMDQLARLPALGCQ